MNRLTVTFVVLAATGGCLGVDPDPTADYGPPRKATSASGQSWSNSGSNWRGANGQPVQGNSPDMQAWMNSPSRSGTSSAAPSSTYPTYGAAATPTTTKTTAAKTTTTAVKSKPKIDDQLVQATATVAPPLKKTTDAGPDLGALPVKCTTSAAPKVAEAKSPPVNLGVLRLLNSKRISFHYEVKDPSASGVAGLELWGTQDMRSWRKYEAVQKTPTSFVVEVKEEGLYGFTMVARGKGEISKDQPPQTGEPPQVWVAVDLTKPTVQMLGAELNIMSKSPTLIIRWTAKDKNFGPRPITLMYAERLDGPWAPITANVENRGLYEWAMPACAPGNLYVRVQATDIMGNLGTAQTTLLHIPGRTTTTVSAKTSEPTASEPPRLTNVPSAAIDTLLRPVSATVPNPAVSILSVDSE